MDIININALLAKGSVVTTLEDGDWFVFSRTNKGQLAGPNPTGGYPLLAISKNDLAVALGSGGTPGWGLNGNSNGSIKYIGTNDNFAFPIYTNGVERARFLPNGNIGFGTPSPITKLQVSANDQSAFIVSTRYESATAAPAGFIGLKARGNSITPSAVLTGDELVAVAALGYHSGGAFASYTGTAIFYAAENFTPTNQGTSFKIGTTAIGSTTLFYHLAVTSQGQVGVGTLTPATSALLDLSSTTGALLVPRMTGAQETALTPTNGMIIYNTSLNKFRGYENGSWTNLV